MKWAALPESLPVSWRLESTPHHQRNLSTGRKYLKIERFGSNFLGMHQLEVAKSLIDVKLLPYLFLYLLDHHKRLEVATQ